MKLRPACACGLPVAEGPTCHSGGITCEEARKRRGVAVICRNCSFPEHGLLTCDQARIVRLQEERRQQAERGRAAKDASANEFLSQTSPVGGGVALLKPDRRKPREEESFAPVEPDAHARSRDKTAPQTEKAMAFLRARLRDGARVLSREIKREAAVAGISEKTLRSARLRLGIKPEVEGFGKDRATYWRLPTYPKDMPTAAYVPLTPISAHIENRAHMDSEGTYGGAEPASSTDTEAF
jgi:hypothetical protein